MNNRNEEVFILFVVLIVVFSMLIGYSDGRCDKNNTVNKTSIIDNNLRNNSL